MMEFILFVALLPLIAAGGYGVYLWRRYRE